MPRLPSRPPRIAVVRLQTLDQETMTVGTHMQDARLERYGGFPVESLRQLT
jgi:hypothetical protein